MQLTLSTPFSESVLPDKPAPQPGSSRDAVAMSQLDQIAGQSLESNRQGLGASAMLLALVGGLVILGGASMWHTGADEPRRPVAAVVEARQTPVALAPVIAPPVATAVEAAPQAASVAALVLVEPAPLAASESAPVAVASAEQVVTDDDSAVRKARAKQLADARRKAAQLTQQRAAADETQRLQAAAQRREADQLQQLAEQARQRAAADEARLASSRLALNTRRSVADLCTGVGGFVSQQFCRSRECGKAEHHGDAVCVRLRDNDLAQQRASNDR